VGPDKESSTLQGKIAASTQACNVGSHHLPATGKRKRRRKRRRQRAHKLALASAIAATVRAFRRLKPFASASSLLPLRTVALRAA
jgi:hypothetical protein